MVIRYNIVRVYPLFWCRKSITINIFRLKFSTEERLAVRILRINGLNKNQSAIKKLYDECANNGQKIIGTVECVATCGTIEI